MRFFILLPPFVSGRQAVKRLYTRFALAGKRRACAWICTHFLYHTIAAVKLQSMAKLSQKNDKYIKHENKLLLCLRV